MTEEEAKTQSCIGPPNCGRVVITGSLHPVAYQPRYCIGSACKLAWRWIEQDAVWSGTYTNQNKPEGEEWYVSIERGDRYGRWMRRPPPTEGYCGLAGKP